MLHKPLYHIIIMVLGQAEKEAAEHWRPEYIIYAPEGNREILWRFNGQFSEVFKGLLVRACWDASFKQMQSTTS